MGKIIKFKALGLTVERLREFKGMEGVTDEEGKHILEYIRRFSMLIIRVYWLKLQQERNNRKKSA